MESTLHCNILACRALVAEQALVTTCSHIFCLPCAEKFALLTIAKSGSQRKCPACHSDLINPNDAVAVQMNPTEDYKSSILSGLNPTIISECAGRGLAFWNYQMAQEIQYQEFLTKSLKEKCSKMSSHVDKIYNEANEEIKRSHVKLQELNEENKKFQSKIHQLEKAYRDRGNHLRQFQKQYQSLKQQQQAAGMQMAADQDAEDFVLQGVGISPVVSNPELAGGRTPGRLGTEAVRSPHVQGGRGGVWNGQALGQGNRNGFQTAQSVTGNLSPQANRSRFPMSTNYTDMRTPVMNSNMPRHINPGFGTPVPNRGNFFIDNDPTVQRRGESRYGMRAGMKVGSPQQSNPFARSSMRIADPPFPGGMNYR